jgi:flagellar protein FlbD
VETGERGCLASAVKLPITTEESGCVRVDKNEAGMIQLTRLNNQPLTVNSDLIKFIEKAPDTVLTLVSGEKVVVLESCEQVLEKVVAFRRTVFSGLKVVTAKSTDGAEASSSAGTENKVE